ncbi:MAG: hypothetical protein ACTS1X_10900 [Parasphingopyxis sp.]|uniref:hypothetical protein n=1 Tax=Parasphingopyxis sp. TaxID=1920299 RepID=UPI003FA15579
MAKLLVTGLFVFPLLVAASACGTEATSAAQEHGESPESSANGGAASTSSPVVLDEAFAFDDNFNCDAGETYDRIFSEMVALDGSNAIGGVVSIPGFNTPLTATVEMATADDGGDMIEASLPVDGIWLGLPVTSLQWDAMASEIGYPLRTVVFDASMEETVAALHEAGFDVALEPNEFETPDRRSAGRPLDDGGYVETMVVDLGDGEGVHFTCRAS